MSETTPPNTGLRNIVLRRMLGMTLSRRHLLSSAEALIDPLAIIGTLWGLLWHADEALDVHWLALSALVLVLSYPSPAYLRLRFTGMVRHVLAAWLVLIIVVASASALVATVGGALPLFDTVVLRDWLWLAPLTQLVAHATLRLLAPMLRTLGPARLAIIAGASVEGARLARQLSDNPYGVTQLLGYFDDRTGDRVAEMPNVQPLGRLAELVPYINSGQANVVYIALPLAAQVRISGLLEALRSCTARVYFVPDALVVDLLRGWSDVVGDAPVVAMLESPFESLSGAFKRLFDIVLAIALILLTLPLTLLLALVVRLNSRGPAFVKHRRYGLDGRELRLYALRATVADRLENELGDRMPPNNGVGRFLRNSGLEKLPRLLNVVQGRLSLVGPRPHAKTHNEIYRRIVKGHLIRHQVRCGITGWAQINGVRGGEKSLDHMKERVSHDLEYLRHWSLRLDLQIMLRAVANLFARRG